MLYSYKNIYTTTATTIASASTDNISNNTNTTEICTTDSSVTSHNNDNNIATTASPTASTSTTGTSYSICTTDSSHLTLENSLKRGKRLYSEQEPTSSPPPPPKETNDLTTSSSEPCSNIVTDLSDEQIPKKTKRTTTSHLPINTISPATPHTMPPHTPTKRIPPHNPTTPQEETFPPHPQEDFIPPPPNRVEKICPISQPKQSHAFKKRGGPDANTTKVKVINLSGRHLTKDEISLLMKGPTFCPSTSGSYLDSKAEIAEFTRKLKIREKYFDSNFKSDIIVKEKNKHAVTSNNNELNTIVEHIENITPAKIKLEKNVTNGETKALKTLKLHKDIIIKKADKGGMFVVMDSDFYRDKMVLQDHLNTDTYEIVHKSADNKAAKKLSELTKKHSKCLHEAEIKYINNKNWKSSNIYVSPKVHKCKEIIEAVKTCTTEYIKIPCPPNLKGRPIIAGPESPTQRLSELLEKLLSPLVPLLKSHIKDDWNFVNRLPQHTDFECELYSVDIVSLYTNIPHTLGIEATSYYVDKFRDHIPARFTKEFIIESILFVLKNNNFFFDGTCRNQKEGTAMGAKMAPPYANLSIGYLEETKLYTELPQHFEASTVELLSRWFLRYIDDGFILWPKGIEIDNFMHLLNNLDPSIQFTLERSTKYITNGHHYQELAFLDVLVIVKNYRTFTTDIHYKETNSHFYLDYHSHHPQHMKDNIPYGLAKKIICFVPDYDRVEFRLQQLKTWLINRNYPIQIIEKKIFNARLEGAAPPPEPKNDIKNKLIFTTTYTNNFSHQNTIHQINGLFHLPRTERIKKVFSNCTTMLAYKQPKNLIRHITKASFESPTNTTHEQPKNGLFRCTRSNCKLCKIYIQECTSFTTHNDTEWQIKSHINCKSKNVIYYLKCVWCDDQQHPTTYTGKTFDLRERMNNHISACRNGGSSDIFDEHVHKCKDRHFHHQEEPYFHIYAYMTLKKQESLLSYEKHLHRKGYDSMNSPH